METDNEKLRSAIVEEDQKIKSEEGVATYHAAALTAFNFDWRIVHEFLLKRVIQNHPEFAQTLKAWEIREAIFEWWVDTASKDEFEQLLDVLEEEPDRIRNKVEYRRGFQVSHK